MFSVSKISIRQVKPLTACLAVLLAWPAEPARGRQPIESVNTECTKAIQAEERRSGVPKHLLEAIASVESGRWNKAIGANIAWPWTVTAQGEGKFYPTRRAAIRAVESLRERGVSNIDVGCMQINLGYHPDAFESLHHAFDPKINVAYAAKFLKTLQARRRNWDKAVRFYHSSDPERQRYYGNKVYKARKEIRLRAARQRRSARAALAEARRASVQTVRAENETASVRGVPFSTWPPRSYRAQRQLELRARNWAFDKRR